MAYGHAWDAAEREGGCGVPARITERSSRNRNQPAAIQHVKEKESLDWGAQGKWVYKERKNRLEQECKWWCNCNSHQQEGWEDDKDPKHLRSVSKGDRRDTSNETELADNRQAEGRWHGGYRRLQRPLPMLGPNVHRMEGSLVLGRNYTQAWAGNWKWWQAHSVLDKEQMRGRINHRPDLGEPTVFKVDDVGGESFHGVWSWDHWMGGGHVEAVGSRRHPCHRVEPAGHVTGGQGAGWEALERAGKG